MAGEHQFGGDESTGEVGKPLEEKEVETTEEVEETEEEESEEEGE